MARRPAVTKARRLAFDGPDATDEEIARLVTVAWNYMEQVKAALRASS